MAGPYATQWIAPYATLTTGENDLAKATQAMHAKELAFPVVVKPDIGCNGTGVKLVHTQEELAQVCASFPRNVELVIQKLITWPHEAGLFYIRHPDEPTGRLTSLTYKDIPFLIGNGRNTVLELLKQDARTSKVLHIYTPRLQHRLHTIPEQGERIDLVFAGNHCKGRFFAMA